MWIDDLFNTNIIPLGSMSLDEQINSMTRLVIVLSIIMILFNFRHTLQFCVISLIFIIILYFVQKTQMNCYENFNPLATKPRYFAPDALGGTAQTKMAVAVPPERNPFCNDEVSGEVGSNGYATNVNQKLAYNGNMSTFYNAKNPQASGLLPANVKPDSVPPTCNPKVLQAPYSVPPTHDLEHWRFNNLITHSAANKESQRDMYLSGYAVATKPYVAPKPYVPRGSVYRQDLTETFDSAQAYGQPTGGVVAPTLVQSKALIPSLTYSEGFSPAYGQPNASRGIVAPLLVQSKALIPSMVEGFDGKVRPNESGWMNTNCSYNPNNLSVNLPSNYPAGPYQQAQSMSDYNKNLFTQTIVPGVYSVNQVDEPLNDNIGISFTQTLNPITKTYDNAGNIEYKQHDPRVFVPPQKNYSLTVENEVRTDNVYDPRLTGYGTSYRSYVDKETGQPRYMYDDIDAVRQPPYICRSNIDNLPFSDGIGISAGFEQGNPNTEQIRDLANQAWVDNSVSFRNDMQEALMRKVNANAWQQRMAPIQTNGRAVGRATANV